jgi:hypothetical protein
MQTVDNPVVLVVPDTVQDYVIRAPAAAATPNVWCSQKVAGAFIGFIGVVVGVTFGVLFGVYYRSC